MKLESRLGITKALIFLLILFYPLTMFPGAQDSPTSSDTHSTYSGKMEKLRDLPYCGESGNSVELVVGLNAEVLDSYAEVEALAEEHAGKILDVISRGGKTIACLVSVSQKHANSFRSKVELAGLSKYIEPNHMFRPLMVPNDPGWQYQWGPKKIQADLAWNTTLGNATVLVSVVDTGIDYNHTDIKANYVQGGENHVWQSGDPYDVMDYVGHGTHVGGIIAAEINNNGGIAGLAQVGIMAEKVLEHMDNWGVIGTDMSVANGIRHAADMGARVISMSIGGYFYSNTVQEAIEYAYYNKTALLVAAAGNEATSCTSYPAYSKEVIAVTATDQNDAPAAFTNFGTWVELAAPGVDIYSTMPNDDYMNASGTSMSAPHVSGVAALVWSKYPNMTRDQVRIHLRKTADDLGQPGFDIHYGYGRVNAKEAVARYIPQHDLVILDWNRPPYMPSGNVTIDATVINYGASNESNVEVQLRMNSSLLTSEIIDYLPTGANAKVSFTWPAPSTGVHNVTVHVVPLSGEADTSDNTVWADVGTEQGKIKVPEYYPTIQEAIDASIPGDIIQVSSGTYNEALNVYRDDLRLIGESRETTVINGSRPLGIWVVYAVDQGYFSIRNFTVQNSGVGYAGIFLLGVYSGYFSSHDSIISNNNIVNNTHGIQIIRSSYNIVADNSLTKNIIGIYMFWAFNTTITSNEIVRSHNEGIILANRGANNIINGNTIESSGDVGVGLYQIQGTNNVVSDNLIRENGYGIIVQKYSIVTGNKIVDNANSGIKLQGSDNIVKNNHFRDNGLGINFSFALASDNSIYWNNFINNTNQASGASANEWNGRWNVTGNYWSDYTGNNTDGDRYGIGDTPYNISENNQDNFPFMSPFLPGDVTHDGKVDMKDIATVSRAYGSHAGPPPSERWDPHADLNEDGFVDDLDLAIVTPLYGQTWQSYWDE